MTWDTAVADVRKIISDGPTDKLAYRKKVIGQQDGTNQVFKTFEARRISHFSPWTDPLSIVQPASPAPAGVYLDNVRQTISTTDGDNSESGEFTLEGTAPTDGQTLVATYYYQWFNDDELQEFLTDAAEWIGIGTDWLPMPEGLRPAAKEFAAHKAYQKLVSKMAVNLAETYQLYDAPDGKRFDPVAAYMKISKDKYDLAVKLRDDVYDGRKGQAKAPRSAVVVGHVRDVPPNR